MAITYSTAAKNARLTAVVNLIDAGSSASLFPKLVMKVSSVGTVLATFNLAGTGTAGVTASASVANGVLTLNDANGAGVTGQLSTTATALGVAGYAEIQDQAGTAVITGLTVGTTGTDIILDNNSLTIGQAITITVGTITHA